MASHVRFPVIKNQHGVFYSPAFGQDTKQLSINVLPRLKLLYRVLIAVQDRAAYVPRGESLVIGELVHT